MYKFILILLIPSVIWGQEPTGESVEDIVAKYKNIKEEIKDRKAEVVTTDAILYADILFNYPVHKLRKGEILPLANFEVKMENVYPVLVNGGVGYVRGGDIRIQKVFENKTASSLDQHSVDYQFEETMSNLDGRTNFVGKISSFAPGSNWSDFSDNAGDREEDIKSFQFMVEFHPRKENFGFGVGPAYYVLEQESISMDTWVFEGQAYWSPAKWRAFQWDIQIGAGFTSGLDIVIKDVEGVNKGYMYSWNLGTSLRFLPDYQFGGIIGANYRTWNISGMKDVVFPNGSRVDLNGFSGSEIYLGLTYKFK